MSLDIFGPSTIETLKIDSRYPTLRFEFPIIKQCKLGTTAAKMKNWQSQFQHGTIRAIDGEYMDMIEDVSIEDVLHTVAKLKESSHTDSKITIAHHKIAQPLTTSGITQLHFDQLHAITHHLHVLKYGEDYYLWGDYDSFPTMDES
jgi:hypothetical protein